MGQMQDEIQADLQARIAASGDIEVANIDPVEIVKIRVLPKLGTMFFFERPDKTIFVTDEQQAALAMKQRTKSILIGTGEGVIFRNYIKDHLGLGTAVTKEEANRIHQEAFDAELVEARLHLRQPVFQAVIFPDGTIPPLMQKDFNTNPTALG